MTHAPAFAAASRLAAPGVAAVQAGHQAGHKVRYFTAAEDLIRVLTYVSACRWLPLNECPYVQSTGQKPEGVVRSERTLQDAAKFIRQADASGPSRP